MLLQLKINDSLFIIDIDKAKHIRKSSFQLISVCILDNRYMHIPRRQPLILLAAIYIFFKQDRSIKIE